MKKLSLSLIAAGLLAGAAGLAQAETLMLQGQTVAVTTAPNGAKTFWIGTPVLAGPVVPGAMPVATIDSTPVATIDTTAVLAAAPVTTYDATVLGAGPVLVPSEPTIVQTPGMTLSNGVPIYTAPDY